MNNKNRKIRIFILILFTIFSFCTGSNHKKNIYLVKRVIDGDTIELINNERIRYIGIDTPERGEFYYIEASNFNRKLVENKSVKLEYDIDKYDKYGRTLAYVYQDTTFVNAKLVESGYAKVMTIPPNTKYKDIFIKLEKLAKSKGIGIWKNQNSN